MDIFAVCCAYSYSHLFMLYCYVLLYCMLVSMGAANSFVNQTWIPFMPRTVGWVWFFYSSISISLQALLLLPSSYLFKRWNHLHFSFYCQVEWAVMGSHFAFYQVLSSSFPVVMIDLLEMTSRFSLHWRHGSRGRLLTGFASREVWLLLISFSSPPQLIDVSGT